MIDIWYMLIFGVIGYVFKKLDYPLAPLVLALVLGDMAENALRQSLIMSQGSLAIFFTRPISGVITAVAIFFFILPLLTPWWRKMRASDRKPISSSIIFVQRLRVTGVSQGRIRLRYELSKRQSPNHKREAGFHHRGTEYANTLFRIRLRVLRDSAVSGLYRSGKIGAIRLRRGNFHRWSPRLMLVTFVTLVSTPLNFPLGPD